EAEDANKDESAKDNKPYLLRKRRDIDYNKEWMIKKQHQDGYSTPSPKLHSNPFVMEKDDLPTSQTCSANTEIDSECESKFRKVIKQATKESRRSATKSLLAELTNNQTLDENLDSVILECLKTLPTEKIKNEPSEITFITNYLDRIMRELFHDPDKHIVEWPNTEFDESKARKRSKQTDFVVSIVHQLQTSGVIFVGEVSPPSEKNNEYERFFANPLILSMLRSGPPSTKASLKRDTLGTPKFKQLVSNTRDCHR
ncbi:35175_t:CDS:2, partial [Gigaspora margarita]